MWNLPNLITLFRISLIPVLVVIYFLKIPHQELVLTIIFVLAGLSDWLDGYLARKLDATTPLGAFLDPVADKLIVSSALVLLVSDPIILSKVFHPMPFAVAVTIIIGREIAISALREWMAELGKRATVKVGIVGKVKTAVQMIAIGMLLYQLPLAGLPIFQIGEILLYAAALLTMWSMYEYLKAAWPVLMEKA